MAVLGRVLIAGAERLDLPDLLSIDSYTAGDFKYLIKSLVGDRKPYVLKGFDVINPGDSIGGQTVSIRVADAVVFYPGSATGPFYYGLPEGDPRSLALIPELRKSATNYVYLTFDTIETAQDTRAFWDPDKEGGIGGEFTQDINTESVLVASVNVSTAAFPENTIPICKVVVGTNFIESIEDCRDMLFRLATGGLTPDPFAQYAWRNDPSLEYARQEPNTLMNSSLQPNPFFGGDKNIQTLKEWMDAMMTKIAEIGGTSYWYEDVATYNLVNLFQDTLATEVKSKGTWELSEEFSGLTTWTEDLHLRSLRDPRVTIIRAGQVTLEDEEVLWIDRDRGNQFNEGNLQVKWVNSQSYVNGLSGAFENLNIGDYVKKPSDPLQYYRRVEAFFFSENLGGGLTTSDTARSIRLSSAYPGVSETRVGTFSKGEYDSSDLIVSNRTDAEPSEAGGNFTWLAARSDFLQNISNIISFALVFNISQADETTAKCETAVAHTLSDGERITIPAPSQYAGTYRVEIETDKIFYINLVEADAPVAPGITENNVPGYYAVVTTTNRTTNVGFIEDSSSHGFLTDQKIELEDTAVGYNGGYKIFVRSATTFTIAIPAPLPQTSQGDARLVRVNVRADLGATKLLPGDIKYIGEVETQNIQLFIGQENPAQIKPQYRINPNYNSLDGMENYNGTEGESLVERISKLTAMMADKAQDKTITKAYSGYSGVTNVTNSLNQELRFVHLVTDTPQLQMIMPGSFATTTLGLTGSISLPENTVAYILIDRNDDKVIGDLSGVVIEPIVDAPIDENMFVIAIRFDTQTCWLFDGTELDVGYTLTINTMSDLLNQNNYDETVLITDQSIANAYEYQAIDPYTEPNLIGVSENTVAPSRIIPLPEDSRNGGAPMDYVIGKGTLEISLNGQVLTPVQDWEEEAAGIGNLSPAIGLNEFVPVHLGTSVTIKRRLFVDDKIRFRLSTTGGHAGPSSASVGAGGAGGETNILNSSGTAGDGLPLNNAKVGVTLFMKRLQAGSNISLSVSPNNNAIIISAAAAGEANDALNLGTGADGFGLYTVKSGVLLPFKRIKAGTNISIVSAGSYLEINSTSAGEVNDIFNNGTISDGEAIASAKTGTNFFLKRIKASSGITVTSNGQSIIIAASAGAEAGVLVERFRNNGITTLTAGTSVTVMSDGSIKVINVSSISDAEGFVGILIETVLPGAYGKVALQGMYRAISSGFLAGKMLYVSKTGVLTQVKPTVGVGGFVNGDWVIQVGLVVVNPDIPAQKDIVLRPLVKGKL